VFLLAVLALFAGCNKKVKAEFERPPAVAAIPEPTDPPTEPSREEIESPEINPEPSDEPVKKEEESPPPRPVPRRRPAPPPEPPPPDPREPRLTDADSPEVLSISDKLTRTEVILAVLRRRSLTAEQREQAATARTFVNQARRALEDGDYRRAAVLADKGLILAEDVRDSSRTGR
jgi:hypothetical protein